MARLVADVGGTYSRIAWLDDSGQSTQPQIYRNCDFTSLEDVIARAQATGDAAGEAIDRMVLALPGPVDDDPIQLTNIDWLVRRDTLRSRFSVADLVIVNDFQAAALGAIAEPHEHLKVLNPATPDEATTLVTGAGTGLGMAWLGQRDRQRLPHSTEGGHMDFAPRSEVQLALYRELADRFEHVSIERILSGAGLVDTHRFFAGPTTITAPAQIVQAATAGDTHAEATINLFVEVFAAHAGNLALAFNPTGGIYLCGGLTAHLADWFDPAAFQSVFSAKGRLSNQVRRIPVFLVTRHGVGIAGAKLVLQNSMGQRHDKQQRTASLI